MQLNWKHQFQFAGYYAAIEQGFFREAGFEVSLRELAAGQDPIASVLNGEADYGVAASELALLRAQGKPVVALAVIVQNSPLILLANRRKFPSIEALSDARIMLLPHEAELMAYLKREGVERFTTVQHNFNPADLLSGQVDAISGYSTDEPFLLRQAGFPYIAYTPKAASINFLRRYAVHRRKPCTCGAGGSGSIPGRCPARLDLCAGTPGRSFRSDSQTIFDSSQQGASAV